MPSCLICERSFTRNEHLQRHVGTQHFPESMQEIFTCDLEPCKFSCKRKEQLNRHVAKEHAMYYIASQQPGGGIQPHVRQIACKECAKAKTKCDRMVPSCARCTSKNMECHPKTSKRAAETASPARQQANLRNLRHNLGRQGFLVAEAMRHGLRRSIPSSHRNRHYGARLNSNIHRQSQSQSPQQTNWMKQEINTELEQGYAHTNPGPPPTPQAQSSPVFTSQMGLVNQPFGFENQTREIKQEYGGMMANSQSQMAPMGVDHANMMSYGQVDMDTSFPMVQNSQMFEPHNMQIKLAYDELPEGMQTVTFSEGMVAPGYWFPDNQGSPFSGSSELSQSTPQLSCPSSSPEPFGMDIRSEYKSPQVPSNDTWSMESFGNNLPVLESSVQLVGQSPWIQCNLAADLDVYTDISTPKYFLRLAAALNACQVQINWQPTLGMATTNENIMRIAPFDENTRSQLTILYSRIAMQNQHPETPASFPWINDQYHSSPPAMGSLTELPSLHMLDMCMEGFARKIEQFYPLLPNSNASPANLLQAGSDPNAMSALLLLMIAGGAEAIQTPAWSSLVNGLVECCRVALFVAGNRDVVTNDITRLRAVLLFLNIGAWSGDKAHTDFVLSQRQSCMDMLRRSGLLQQRQQTQRHQDSDAMIGVHGDFQRWQKREATNRLVYSWVLVDQELGLFGDCKASFDINSLKLDMPCSDDVWKMSSAEEWSNNPQVRLEVPSLYTLYTRLRISPGDFAEMALTPLQLRLLLYPLQGMIHTLVSCLNNNRNTPPQQTDRQFVQLETAQADLEKWYELMQQCMDSVAEPSPFMITNLIMYHLISLNTMSCFPHIEELARGHMTPAVYLEKIWARSHSQFARFHLEVPKIFWHCGSILRLFKELREPDRPRWLPAALYRAALTLWAASFTNASNIAHAPPVVDVSLPMNPDVYVFPIDRPHPFHGNPAFESYWHYNHGQQIGVPAFFAEASGTWVGLDNRSDILFYCAHLMKECDGEGKLADRVFHDLLHMSQRAAP